MVTTEGKYNGLDGAELFYRRIQPKTKAKAVIMLIHGFGDHSGGLQNITSSLAKNHYIVYAVDLRGHGKSSGKRGFIRSWNEFRGDIHELRKLVTLKEPNLPLYVIGHSMGGVISLDYSLKHSEGIAGVVAISPGISYEPTAFERLGVLVMGKLKPDLKIIKSGNFQLQAKDPALQAKYNPEGLRHNTATPGLGRGLLQASKHVVNNALSINVPLLLQYGVDDKITPPKKLNQFFKQVGSKDKQVLEYPNARHRPFDEAGREKFLGDLISWLDQQIDNKNKVLYKSAGRL
ncbi:alpha/beta hydrolase [Mesobacillus maritimus]|uniref:Alpha/beta hydrolase n=1 Tax=Mesobacillus maritimus TaxID=1643336 RepID=A0ABS7K221_9BACI|nr:alpha/beta hydrolase [Mesobacillus maritimus]MBY0096225.1 alpha/beta hydrolase [Mesobacillus maritimus]